MKRDKSKAWLMVTLLIVALVQMPSLALTPAINQIQTAAFRDYTLAQVQTALAWTNLVSPLASILAAFFINRGVLTKKAALVAGLLMLSFTGVLAVLFHRDFWNLYLLSISLGLATGLFMTNAFGLLFDNFNDQERQTIAGYQTSCINAGGISMGLLGGLMATALWYGGYLILLIGLPIAVLALFTVPSYKSPAATKTAGQKASRLHSRILYYAALACIFMMIYGVGGSNISTHIKQNLPGVDDAAIAGVAVAVQMGGGVLSGLFFGKLSKKLGDKIMFLASLALFVGFMILSLGHSSLALLFVGVFIAGTSLSMMLPRCTFAVSTLADKSTSALATVIALSIAPSLGGFLSPLIFTNVTTALFGKQTAPRYAFVAVTVLIFGLIVLFVTRRREKAEAAVTAGTPSSVG